MAKLLDSLKSFIGGPGRSSRRGRPDDPSEPRRQDPAFVGRSSIKEIEQAAPERVGELVGHAPERVET